MKNISKTRASKALSMIKAKRTSGRSFSALFENGDGDVVAAYLVHRIRANSGDRAIVASYWGSGELVDGMPAPWVSAYDREGPALQAAGLIS